MTTDTMDGTERDIASRAREHLLALLFEQHLKSERDDAKWWAEQDVRRETWADLYAEHQARLALLERMEAASLTPRLELR